MTFKKNPRKEIDQRQTTIDTYERMREAGSNAAVLGLFYREVLKAGIWRNQADLAKGLGISASQVSRAVGISRIPETIISFVGGPDKTTIRLAKRIDDLVKNLGVETILRNAANLQSNRFRSMQEVAAALATGRDAPPPKPSITLQLDKSNRFIRIESPYIAELAANLGALEELITVCVPLAVRNIYPDNRTLDKPILRAYTTRADAIIQHSKLKFGATLADYGRFYQAMLSAGVWSSQRQIAADVGLSKDVIGRRIVLSLIPIEVAVAFGGYDYLSLRTAKAVTSLISSVGATRIKANAGKIIVDAKRPAAETLALLEAS